MNESEVKKIAVSFGLLSFMVLVLGSLVMGAGLLTAFGRGVVGGIVFGLLALIPGHYLIEEPKENHEGEHIFEDPDADFGNDVRNKI